MNYVRIESLRLRLEGIELGSPHFDKWVQVLGKFIFKDRNVGLVY